MTLAMCVNYGGRAEIVDAARAIADDVARGALKARQITESTFANYLDEPDMPDVDLFLRPSGEQRTSNFLPWQSTYAEMVYQDVLFPDYTPNDLRRRIGICEARPSVRWGQVERKITVEGQISRISVVRF